MDMDMDILESEWLRETISFSLKATTETLPTPPKQDPRLAKLKEGILFSRRLILSYHLIIVAFILLISAFHCSGQFTRWRNRRRNRRASRAYPCDTEIISYDDDIDTIRPSTFSAPSDSETKGILSSSCSTIDGTSSPPRKEVDEETFLLDRGHVQPLSLSKAIIPSIQAFWISQPSPIPIVNKVLPSNGISFVVLAFLALNGFFTFYHISFTFYEVFILADRCGLMFVANLPLLYLLAAKTQPLRVLTGRSYESLNIFHRRLGELLCLLALLHTAGMVEAWWILIRPNGFGFIRFLSLKMCLLGIGAFVSYELLWSRSLGSFRQRWYELFLCSHVMLQIAALVCVYFHHHAARRYVLIALMIFLVDRLVYRLGIKSMTIEAETKILKDEGTVRLSSIIIQRSQSRFSKMFGKTLKAGWSATDHVFITVPSMSRSHIIQAHPFTIASAAPHPGDHEVRMDLLIRAQEGFSRDLLNAARLHKRLTVRIDGPYGSSHARDVLEGSELALLVAGGSGIAVCWPLVQHLLNITRSSDTDLATTRSLRRQKIVLVWIIHEGAHLSWLGRQALAEADYQGVEIIVPQATEEAGRPDLKSMINEIVDRHTYERGQKIRCVASGPDGMGRLVRNAFASLVREGRDADVTIEKFGW